MPSGKSVVALILAATIAVTMFTPIHTTAAENSGTQTVTNETVIADTDSYVEVDGYDLDSGSETVYWKNSSSGNFEQVSKGSDYAIKYGAGSIKANATGTIGDGDTLKVSYTYQATDGATTVIVGLISLFVALLILGVLASAVDDYM